MSNFDEDDKQLKDYIRTLRRKLFWMSGSKKKLLVEETKFHLLEVAEDIGGPKEQAYKKAIDRFGSPKQIAKQYKKHYGYGKKFTVVMVLLVIFFATFTLPILSNLPAVGETPEDRQNVKNIAFCCGAMSVLNTIFVYIVIIFAGVKGGKWQGLIVGSFAFATRTVILMFWGLGFAIINAFINEQVLSKVEAVDISVNIGLGGGQVCLMMFISLLMIPTGFLAGRTIKKLKKEKLFEDEAEDDEELESY